MLKLVNITKDYVVADTKIRALKGLNLCFRRNEFVSVLGPSGCGKTTLLNIIGGLDHCTSGDLAIYGRSTREYKDRDWDVYRNHRIGFIFQSYNLIPHQTVLGNVELALTIAGMNKAERVKKAKAALDKVGLSDQYYKKPNQLSGGQCQRVAIARALVNDPEILLADEPTGALDTVTSKQIMDLIQEIAKERLVIMVTHNPELAEEYSTRIIRLLDGNLVDDSNPFSEEGEKKETEFVLLQQVKQAREKFFGKENSKNNAANENNKENNKGNVASENTASENNAYKQEKAKMSFWTAFKLSLQNLFTKKRRTLMTSVAGSIGIIGVSLVLSVSIGLQGFINKMQNDMLAGFPIEITRTAFDINSLMSGGLFGSDEQKEILDKGNWVNVESMIAELNKRLSEMENMQVENDIDKNYVTYIKDMPQEYWNAIHLDYGLDVSNSIYTNFKYPVHPEGRETSITGIKSMYSSILQYVPGFESFVSYIDMLNSSFAQAPDTRNKVTEEYLKSQYDILYSREGTNGIAKNANEVMIVLNKDRTIADLTLGQIGYYGQDEFINIVNKAIDNDYDKDLYDDGKVEYSALADMPFTWYPNNSIFTENSPASSTPFTYKPYASNFKNGLPLTVVGILEPKEELNYGMLSSGFYYTTALAEHSIEQNWDSSLAKYLRENQKSDTLSGTAVIIKKGTVIEIDSGLKDDNGEPIMIPQPPLSSDMIQVVNGKVIAFDYEFIYEDMPAAETAKGLIDSSSTMRGLLSMFMGGGATGISMVSYSMSQLGGNVESIITKDDSGNITDWKVEKDDNGNVFAIPVGIAIYPPDFSQKDKAIAWLDVWNDKTASITLSTGKVLSAESREKIVYSDMLSLIMRMVSSLLQMVTIALVGFTSLALVVSCVMIGIITYVSVVERIKEIGVIRSLGGRKRDVSNLFTAETFIIGLASGLIGIFVTYVASAILNLAVGAAGIAAIASFPWWVALIMVGVSVSLTLISGLMPSKSAANKDPVVALRTE